MKHTFLWALKEEQRHLHLQLGMGRDKSVMEDVTLELNLERMERIWTGNKQEAGWPCSLEREHQ